MKKKWREEKVSSPRLSPESSFTISQNPKQSLRTRLSRENVRAGECKRKSEMKIKIIK